MRIKLFFMFLFFLLSKCNNGFCQAAYLLNTPTNWTIERFDLPPVFAPGLPIKGTEDIRFSPGWSKRDNENYWSYCYLWTLQSGEPLTQADLETCLKFYYTGLVRSNLTDTAHLIPVTIKLHRIPNVAPGRKAFKGEIHMLDYMSKQPIILNLKIHQKNNFIFFEVSPLPYANKIWVVMDSALKEIKL